MGYVKSSRAVRKVAENPTHIHVQRDNSINNKNILLTQSDFVKILSAYVNIKKFVMNLIKIKTLNVLTVLSVG